MQNFSTYMETKKEVKKVFVVPPSLAWVLERQELSSQKGLTWLVSGGLATWAFLLGVETWLKVPVGQTLPSERRVLSVPE